MESEVVEMKQAVQARSKLAVATSDDTESEMYILKCQVANLKVMVVKDSKKMNGNTGNGKLRVRRMLSWIPD